MKTHKDLEAWRLSIDFVTDIYRLTDTFPKTEVFGLVAQIRRSAISVPSNIAEGAARRSPNEFRQFLYVSLGSASELDTQLIIAENLEYIDRTTLEMAQGTLNRISRLLQGLIRSTS